MSNSLAAAKKRRAPPQQTPVPGSQSAPSINRGPAPGPQMATPGLTLPQVIALVDKRLVMLETGMRELTQTSSSEEETSNTQIPSNITEVLDEFNVRFDTLAEEIGNLKNVVLSLQSYTMDVNKMLLEDRVRILTDDSQTNVNKLPNLSV
jgi:enamine deaminase RidA (YjgF/YER057c/UK114 family)